MKKLLLLFGLITLGLINFSSAGTINYSGTYTTSINSSSQTAVGNIGIKFPLFSNKVLLNGTTITYNCTFSNLNNGGLTFTTNNGYGSYFQVSFFKNDMSINVGSNGYKYMSQVLSNSTINGTDTLTFSDYGYLNSIQFNFYYQRPNSSTTVSFDYDCSFQSDSIVNISSLTSDLSSCQSDLTTCQNSSSSCSPSGSCTVNNKIDENILYTGSVSLNNSSYTNIFNYGNNGAGTYCVKLSSSSPQTLTFGFTNSSTGTPTNLYQLNNDQYGNWICLYGNKSYFNAKLNSSSNTVSYEIYKLTDLLGDDIPCSESSTPECDDWTQLQCESEYNLIPESSINSEYCEEQFNLIDPENCPASGGTGDVQWSSFFVNSHQIQGASNIYLWLPDFLNWDYTYIDSGSTLEIDVENEGDQEYINSILDIQSYHPDNDQFAISFAGFLTLLMPYIIITLFVIFIWRLIKRIFK